MSRSNVSWRLLLLFAVGAVASPIGDAGHVQGGVTFYDSIDLPVIWESPLSFPAMVGAATVLLGLLSWRLSERIEDRSGAEASLTSAVAAVAGVMLIYAASALLPAEPMTPVVVLMVSAALLVWAVLDKSVAGFVVGIVAAVGGSVTEIVLIDQGLFHYSSYLDSLFGVAPWLPALYFAFGVSVNRIALVLWPRGIDD